MVGSAQDESLSLCEVLGEVLGSDLFLDTAEPFRALVDYIIDAGSGLQIAFSSFQKTAIAEKKPGGVGP